MTSFFARFRNRDGAGKKSKRGDANDANQQPQARRWDDASARTSVEPEEVQELIKRCTEELKSRCTYSRIYIKRRSRPLSTPGRRLSPRAGYAVSNAWTHLLQLWATPSYSCPSDLHPTRALSGLSYATSSIHPSKFAARRLPRSCA